MQKNHFIASAVSTAMMAYKSFKEGDVENYLTAPYEETENNFEELYKLALTTNMTKVDLGNLHEVTYSDAILQNYIDSVGGIYNRRGALTGSSDGTVMKVGEVLFRELTSYDSRLTDVVRTATAIEEELAGFNNGKHNIIDVSFIDHNTFSGIDMERCRTLATLKLDAYNSIKTNKDPKNYAGLLCENYNSVINTMSLNDLFESYNELLSCETLTLFERHLLSDLASKILELSKLASAPLSEDSKGIVSTYKNTFFVSKRILERLHEKEIEIEAYYGLLMNGSHMVDLYRNPEYYSSFYNTKLSKRRIVEQASNNEQMAELFVDHTQHMFSKLKGISTLKNAYLDVIEDFGASGSPFVIIKKVLYTLDTGDNFGLYLKLVEKYYLKAELTKAQTHLIVMAEFLARLVTRGVIVK